MIEIRKKTGVYESEWVGKQDRIYWEVYYNDSCIVSFNTKDEATEVKDAVDSSGGLDKSILGLTEKFTSAEKEEQEAREAYQRAKHKREVIGRKLYPLAKFSEMLDIKRKEAKESFERISGRCE